jgi:hypothetical protein
MARQRHLKADLTDDLKTQEPILIARISLASTWSGCLAISATEELHNRLPGPLRQPRRRHYPGEIDGDRDEHQASEGLFAA